MGLGRYGDSGITALETLAPTAGSRGREKMSPSFWLHGFFGGLHSSLHDWALGFLQRSFSFAEGGEYGVSLHLS